MVNPIKFYEKIVEALRLARIQRMLKDGKIRYTDIEMVHDDKGNVYKVDWKYLFDAIEMCNNQHAPASAFLEIDVGENDGCVRVRVDWVARPNPNRTNIGDLAAFEQFDKPCRVWQKVRDLRMIEAVNEPPAWTNHAIAMVMVPFLIWFA